GGVGVGWCVGARWPVRVACSDAWALGALDADPRTSSSVIGFSLGLGLRKGIAPSRTSISTISATSAIDSKAAATRLCGDAWGSYVECGMDAGYIGGLTYRA